VTATAPARPANVAGGSASPSAEALHLKNATMIFGGLAAVRDISLSVAKGTILGIIGPSGAGKTTMVRLLTGALKPTRGAVRVLGEDPRQFRRRTREKIGYMPQQFTLYPDLTARENVNFVASLFGLLWPRRRRRVREVLQTVDLWAARGRRAADLSGGMQRRLELASALVHEPALLFLDEPTAGIDPLLRARVWEELHRLKSLGRTLLVTTQYVTEAEECDMVALIAEGHLIALDTPHDLRRKATGGDLVEVETAARFNASKLVSLAQVRSFSQQGPRTFRVTVDDAGTATADVVAAVAAAGGEVASAREYRLSFDEVFAELVARDRAASTAAAADADGSPTDKAETDARDEGGHDRVAAARPKGRDDR
jgi:ABC-2 type transport system ATP-binding protein